MNDIKLFVCQTDCTDPARNLAAEELLFWRVRPGEVGLYLWRNARTIVVGRNQDAWRECDAALFEREGGTLARRLSGGGAVYHDLGNQNFTFIARQDWFDTARHARVIRLAAQRFGIDAVIDGRNDILAEGRKFSGNAYYRSGVHCYHHGTILIDVDMSLLSRYLHPHPEKLAGKGVASVVSRVINLRELNPSVTAESMRLALIDAFEEVYRARAERLSTDCLPADDWDALTARYADPAWRLGEPKPYTTRLAKRFGFGEIDLQLTVEAGVITRARVYSDAMDAEFAPALAESITGAAYSRLAIADRIETLSSQWPDESRLAREWILSNADV
ncbi:MAG: lipoate--protein ligase [Oscillospiraceae bacterium]|jgi:lipoate-protein ligase A|nr:lipoate--protein ligase [Oscillospiraceae bacterium]